MKKDIFFPFFHVHKVQMTLKTIYDKNFPVRTKQIKLKDLKRPWITKGIKKSSRKKQRLYIKFLKSKTSKSETEYKNYKNLFEKIKKKSKNLYYSSLLKKYENKSKKTWQVMKEITGKSKINTNIFPKMLKMKNEITYDTKKITNEFNDLFTNNKKIPKVVNSFHEYLTSFNKFLKEDELSFDEFETAFKNLKRNKASGADELNSNVVIEVYDEIKETLYQILKSSIDEGIFPDLLKIAKVIPIYKYGDTAEVENYRPISILPIFSKVLERNV